MALLRSGSPGPRAGSAASLEYEGSAHLRHAFEHATRIAPDRAFGTPLRRFTGAGPDFQVNDPSLDHFTDFPDATPPIAPLWTIIQSETSLAVRGNTVVVTYNTTAGIQFVLEEGKPKFARVLLAGFSTSSDGGVSWLSGFMPSIGSRGGTHFDNAVEVDRAGRFYALYGVDDEAHPNQVAIGVSRSDDGVTWRTPVPIEFEASPDKPWMAVGPDPSNLSRDAIYVVWTQFGTGGSELRLGRSTDGGDTFTSGTLFAPVSGSAPYVSSSNPVVDPSTGRLWVPFVRWGPSGFFFQMRSSADGGSFAPVRFGLPSAPDALSIPFNWPGSLCDCGSEVGTTSVLHAGPNVAAAGNAPRYASAWWVGNQPTFGSRGDFLALAWTSKTGALSNVWLLLSRDGGASWEGPRRLDPEGNADLEHVEPALAVDQASGDVHVAYYTQHADETIDVDLATLRATDGHSAITTTRLTTRSSTIPLSNVTTSSGDTQNVDVFLPCYSLGHYMMARALDGTVHVAWGDSRNSITHPVNSRDPLSGQTHTQPDVFYRKVRP